MKERGSTLAPSALEVLCSMLSKLSPAERNLIGKHPDGLGAARHHPVFADLIAWLVMEPCPHCGFAPHDLDIVAAEYAKGNADRLRDELMFHRQILNHTEVRCLDCQQPYNIPFYLTEEIT